MNKVNGVVWGKRDLNADSHWKNIELENYSTDKPIVVCIGGNGTVSEKSANGVCKIVENYLQLLLIKDRVNRIHENVDIIGAVYPVLENNERGKFSNQDINDFVDNFLIKIIQDENDEIYPLNEACRRLSKITFFTFCRGHLEVEKILHAFFKELRILGYSEQERNVLMQSIMEISFAPLTYSAIIPIVFVDSKYDEMINYAWKNNETKIHIDGNLNGVAVKYERYGDPLMSGVAVSESVFDSIHIYSSRLRNNINSDEHKLSLIARDETWNASYEPNADCVSQMVAWALCRAVENGIDNRNSKKFISKMHLEELMTELEGIKDDFTPEQLMSKE